MTNDDLKIACMSLMWGHCALATEDVPRWLDEVAEAGYAGVALFDRELGRFMQESEFHELLKDRSLELSSVDYSIDRDFDRLRGTCEFMRSLNARHLVTIGGLATRDADPVEIADILNEIGEIALEYGVHACYHNHTDNTGETLEETEHLPALTDPGKFFGFVDTGHATKDFVGHPVERRAALCDYDAVFQILKEKGYSGWITVEQNGPMGDKTPVECAKASREFIRKGLSV